MYEFFSVRDGEYIQAIQDARALFLGEEFKMSDNWFVQHPEVMEFILEHEAERSGQEKLEQDLLDARLTINLWNSYTNKIGQASLTVGCYDEQSQHEFFF